MIVPASADAAMAANEDLDAELMICRVSSSLLVNSFNQAVAAAQDRGVEYFAMLHADIAPASGWLAKLWAAMHDTGLDVVHAPVAIKDYRGLTSTAFATTDDVWDDKRRITTTELQSLPDVFTVADVAECIDESATILLPNTGVLLVRCGEWFAEWEGFHMLDRVATVRGKRRAQVVPEDWLFGYEAAAMGLKVGGCKVPTIHFGGTQFTTAKPWGEPTDTQYKTPEQEAI
jgi:hypothetical protein